MYLPERSVESRTFLFDFKEFLYAVTSSVSKGGNKIIHTQNSTTRQMQYEKEN